MNRQDWLTHIRMLKPLVDSIEQTKSEAVQLELDAEGLLNGPLRRFYQIQHLNGLFALVIIPYLFVFHLLFGPLFISLYQLLSFDFFLYKAVLIFFLFIIFPIGLYFSAMHGMNILGKYVSQAQVKTEQAFSALHEARICEQKATEELCDMTDIPLYYLKPYPLKQFESYFQHHRADSLKEAINLFETEKSFLLHQYTMFRFHGEKRLYSAYEQAVQFDKQAQ